MKNVRPPVSRRRVMQAAALLAAPACGPALATPAPGDASVYIITPVDGQRVKSPFICRFGLRNMGVAPAGVATPGTGHHHLLVDVAEPLDLMAPIPADNKHLHFGKGQTETQLDLPPGVHTLQLVMGDADHAPLEPSVTSRKIRIFVERPHR